MRILQVISSVSPAFGGPAIASVRLNEALNRSGQGGILISTDLASPGGQRLSPREVGELGGPDLDLSLGRVSYPPRLEFSFELIPRLWTECGKHEGVLLHGLHRPPVALAFVIAVIRGKAVIVFPHGLLETFDRKIGGFAKKIFNRFLTPLIIKRSACVIFTASSEARDARPPVAPEKVFIHPLGAELPPSTPPDFDRVTLAEFECRPLNEIFGFIGRLASKKQPELLLHAWARSGSSDSGLLVFVGPEDDWSRQELKAIAQDLGVTRSVMFLDPVAGGHLTWVLEHLGTVILPSKKENFGMVVGEAMWCGKHVITTKETAASDHLVLSESGTVLSDPTADDLATAIDSATRDLSGGSGLRARDYASSVLTWDSLAKALYLKLEQLGVGA